MKKQDNLRTEKGTVLKTGIVFTLKGDNYNITLFSEFQNEDEILLEPERKTKVDDVLDDLNGVINVTCTIIESEIMLENIIKPDIILEEKSQKASKVSNFFNKRANPQRKPPGFAMNNNNKPSKIDGFCCPSIEIRDDRKGPKFNFRKANEKNHYNNTEDNSQILLAKPYDKFANS